MLDQTDPRESRSQDLVRDPREIPDEELATLSARGDAEAFGVIYERYFDGLYDFAYRTVRNRDAAADIVQDTFTKAWQSLPKARAISNVKAWLYMIARNSAIDDHRRRERLVGMDPSDEDVRRAPDELATLADPQEAIAHKEVVELVWDSAASLGPNDYTLLDLHVRRDLSVGEIADGLGLQKGAVYTRLTRLRRALEQSVTAHTLARMGRRRCETLDRLLDGADTRKLTPELRRVITEHVEECDECRATRRRFVSPIELLAALLPVPAHEGVKEAIWQNVSAAIDGGRAGDGPAPSGGRWIPKVVSPSKGAGIITVAGASIIAVIAALLVTSGGGAFVLRDPSDVHSTSHAVGDRSTDNTVAIAWTPVAGASGYSIDWAGSADGLPDATVDLPGSAAGSVSPPLPEGSWYFHLRTKGEGEWTSTEHLGPFVITGSDDSDEGGPDDPIGSVARDGGDRVAGSDFVLSSFLTPDADPSDVFGPVHGDGRPQGNPTPSPQPSPSPTPSPTPTPSPSPSPTPTGSPTPTPEPSPTPSPEPSPEPTPSPTPTPEPSGTFEIDPPPTERPTESPEPSEEPQTRTEGSKTGSRRVSG